MFQETPGKPQILLKVFSFDGFPESIKFSYLVGEIAQMLNHHPAFYINWDKVTIKANTWALNNSNSDFNLRSAILFDQIYCNIIKNDL